MNLKGGFGFHHPSGMSPYFWEFLVRGSNLARFAQVIVPFLRHSAFLDGRAES